MKLDVNKLPEFWRDITRDRDIAYKDRVWMEGYDAALVYCAEKLEAAIAQQAGAVGESCRFFADGPENSFFTRTHADAERLIKEAGFDRDEWTVTDLRNPTGAPSAPGGVGGGGCDKCSEVGDEILRQEESAQTAYDEGLRIGDDQMSNDAVERLTAINAIGRVHGCLVDSEPLSPKEQV